MKVAILVPCYSDAKRDFCISLARLVWHTARNLPDVDLETFTASNSIVTVVRNALVDEAREWGADLVLWIDADHTFPPNGLERLLGLGLDVVGCNYIRRLPPHGPTAVREAAGRRELVETTEDLVRRQVVERVVGLGLGFCLMRLSVLALPAPVFRYTYDEAGETGEDHYLFGELTKRGIAIHVDHWLSWQVGHIGETIHAHKGGASNGTVSVPSPRRDQERRYDFLEGRKLGGR